MVVEIMTHAEKIGKKMAIIAKQIGSRYTLKSKPLTNEEVFAETGLMPGIAKRADQLASLCLGYGIGVTFEDEEKSLLGKKVKFDEFTPDSIRLMCLTDVLFELIKTSPSKDVTSLDELMYD